MISLSTTHTRVLVYDSGVRVADLAPSVARELQQALNRLYPPEPLQLVIGGTYKARDGSTHGPLEANPGSFPFRSTAGVSWTATGYYLAHDKPDPLDLVERLPD
jgi:hypothetical protein